MSKHRLPEGFQYRDSETVRASQLAARFGESFQAFADERSEEKRRTNNFTPSAPKFNTDFQNDKIGIELKDNKMFDVFDAKFLNPFTETRSNKPLEEILIEQSTSRTRLLPGEGLAATPTPPTRPPNRLIDLSKPVKESERSKNSRLGTIFDGQHVLSFLNSPRSLPTGHFNNLDIPVPFVHF